MYNRKPILVTGSHRSGSTWIGNIISSASNVFYIQEPFNLSIKRKSSPCRYWFEYVEGKSKFEQLNFLQYLKSFYTFNYKSFLSDLSKIRSAKELKLLLQDFKNKCFYRPLIKDPISIMSSEWYFKELNCDIIVSIRHPAAFVASLKIKDWHFDFNNFLEQEALMNSHLTKYRSEIENHATSNYAIIQQGVLLWNTIYSTVLDFQKKYGDQWLFVKHEEVSYNPLTEFKRIFDFLDLEMNAAVRNWIQETSYSGVKDGFKRNSKENIKTWRERLTRDEIAYIKETTNPIWSKFYNEEDWNLEE